MDACKVELLDELPPERTQEGGGEGVDAVMEEIVGKLTHTLPGT